MKLHKKLMVVLLLGLTAVSLAACSDVDDWSLSLKSKIGQLPLIVSTYDANGQKIDQIKAKSVHNRLHFRLRLWFKRPKINKSIWRSRMWAP